MAASALGVHLVVCQHGLWGNPDNLEYMVNRLTEWGGEQTVVINSHVSKGTSLTHDGIDACGDRLVQLIKDTVCEMERPGLAVTKLSLLGYSMGGLIARYCAGRLHADGFFAKVQPVNFVAVATPHLGSVRARKQALDALFNTIVPLVCSRTGYQLMLQDRYLDGKPLLQVMADPGWPFFQSLAMFRKRVLLACIKNDRSVPFCTGAIELKNPFETKPYGSVDPSVYPYIVQLRDDEGTKVERLSRGYYFRLALLLVLSPIIIPSMIASVVKGRRHYQLSLQSNWDPMWLHTHKPTNGIAPAVADAPVADATVAPAIADATVAPAVADATVVLQVSDEVLTGKNNSLGINTLETAYESVEDALQSQIALHLNTLVWTKVYVDPNHFHGHAAIVLRNRSRFKRHGHIVDYLMAHLEK